MTMRTLFLLSAAATALAAQDAVVFEQRPGRRFSNDKLELIVLSRGGAFSSLLLRDDPRKIDPIWNPARLARETGVDSTFGASFGHFVCVDGFGPVSEQEQAAGLPGHGEAHRQPWELVSAGKSGKTLTAIFRAALPLVQEVLTRKLEMVDGENVVWVESGLESLVAFDRPVFWAEHGTIGAPFLAPETTVVDSSVAGCRTRAHPAKPGAVPRRLAPSRDFVWPMAPTVAGGLVDLRIAPANPNSMDHTTCLMDPNRGLVFVTALNLEKRLLLGYLFRREEFPWVQNWMNYPPSGKLVRGLEFSTQPFDVPRRQALEASPMFGAPTYRWLPAKSKIGSRYLMFYTQVPEGLRRVDDVTLAGGRLTVEDRSSGVRVVLAASLSL